MSSYRLYTTRERKIISAEYPRGGVKACQCAGIERSAGSLHEFVRRTDIGSPAKIRRYEYQGRLLTITELAAGSDNIPRAVIVKRIEAKWPVAEAVECPVRGRPAWRRARGKAPFIRHGSKRDE